MSAGLPRPSSDENISTTLSSGITDIATSMDVADASKIVSPCYLVIDRVDSSGTLKATSLWEYVKVTNVASNTLTITRGQGGSTGQAHSSGAVVEAVVTSSMFEDWYAVLNPEHDAAGGHVIATATITTVRTITYLNASGASISGNFPIHPTWVATGVSSAATVGVGGALTMPQPGSFQWATVTLSRGQAASSASIVIDINKNGVSLFDAGTRPFILGSGTFASTASLAVKAYIAGDVIDTDIDNVGNKVDLTVTLRGG